MDTTHSQNKKDKINALSFFISEIENSNLTDIDTNSKNDINDLKRICRLIDQYINESIDFAKTRPLKSERIEILISESIKLKKIQLQCEEKLINLKSERNRFEENEIKVAFDFELDKQKEITFIENATEIEKRIKDEINDSLNSIFKNEFPKIFSDGNAYVIFLKLHNVYKTEKTHLANYSFIYNSMYRDSFIICKGTEFINFLNENYDITIDKIDSRQNGRDNKKYKFYNSIKS